MRAAASASGLSAGDEIREPGCDVAPEIVQALLCSGKRWNQAAGYAQPDAADAAVIMQRKG